LGVRPTSTPGPRRDQLVFQGRVGGGRGCEGGREKALENLISTFICHKFFFIISNSKCNIILNICASRAL